MFTLDGKTVYELPELGRALKGFEADRVIAFDTETSGLSFKRDVIATIQLYGEQSGTALLAHVRGRTIPELMDLLGRPGVTFVGHNIGGFDLLFATEAGLDIWAGQEWYDTLVAEMVITPKGRSNVRMNLKATLQRRLGVKVDKEIEHSWMNDLLTPEQKAYAMRDVFHLPELRQEQLQIAERNRQVQALQFEIALVPVFTQMMRHGIPVNMEKLHDYSAKQLAIVAEEKALLIDQYGVSIEGEVCCPECGGSAIRVKTEEAPPSNNAKVRAAYRYVDHKYVWKCLQGCDWQRVAILPNLGSSQQKLAILRGLGVPDGYLVAHERIGRQVVSKPSSAAPVLKSAITRLRMDAEQIEAGELPFGVQAPAEVTEYSRKAEAARLRQLATIIDHLQRYTAADTRAGMWASEQWQEEHIYRSGDGTATMYPRFWQCGANTGRVISSKPNGQQIPQDAREIFGWVKGHSIITVDYSGIETVVAAFWSKDQALIEALRSSDFHTSTGSLIFKKPKIRLTAAQVAEYVALGLSETEMPGVTPKQRQLAKGASFTLLFGGGWQRIYEYAWEEGVPTTTEEARRVFTGFFEKYAGLWAMRERTIQMCKENSQLWLTLPNGLKRLLIGEDLKPSTVLNTIVQGTAGVGIKQAMIDLLREAPDLVRYLFLQVHDELVFCVPEAEAEEAAERIREIMVAGMLKWIPGMPVSVGVAIAPHWSK